MKPQNLLLASVWTAIAASSPVVRRADGPSVTDTSTQVTYIGNTSYGVESFLNIKFGQDTGGDNRFKAPQSFSYPANTVVNATIPGAACPQQLEPVKGIPLFDNVTNYSEDCLTLRVDRPANTSSDAKLPVMVWIYGGGFAVGQIYDSAYTSTLMVASAAEKQTPFIYVAMNYRVGIFGFAAGPDISPDDLNAGLLDQRLALQWIQQNIHLFGGDPDNITLFGESAGAISVGIHLVSYAGNSSMAPPIQRGIMQSGGPTGQTGVTTNKTANHTATIIDLVNCTSTTEDYAAELSCLRALPLDTLVNISTTYSLSLNGLGGFNTFACTVPSTILPSAPSTLLSTGQFHKNISLISGWTENDGSLFVPPTIATETDLVTWLSESNYTNSTISQILDLYPADSFSAFPSENITDQWSRASQIDRDRSATCVSLLINSAMANASSNSSNPPITNYLYALNSTLFTDILAATNRSYIGVPHFSDIGFVFDLAPVPEYRASQENIALADVVSGSWAAFATDGTPDAGSNTTVMDWTEGATAGQGMEFGVRVLGGPRDGMVRIGDGDQGDLPRYDEQTLGRCQFWNSLEVLEMNGT